MTTVSSPAGTLSKSTDNGLQGVPTSTDAAAAGASSGKIAQAAREFESVFLRQMLSALERTTKVGDKGPNVAGQQAYGSMIVEAVADAIAKAGGIGLGQVLAKALESKAGPAKTDETPASAPQPLTAAPGKIATPTANTTNFAQGLSHEAVPITEIRTSASQRMGQLADRRIR